MWELLQPHTMWKLCSLVDSRQNRSTTHHQSGWPGPHSLITASWSPTNLCNCHYRLVNRAVVDNWPCPQHQSPHWTITLCNPSNCKTPTNALRQWLKQISDTCPPHHQSPRLAAKYVYGHAIQPQPPQHPFPSFRQCHNALRIHNIVAKSARMCVNAYMCVNADDEKLMVLKYKKSVNKMQSTTTMDNTTYIHKKWLKYIPCCTRGTWDETMSVYKYPNELSESNK